MNDFLVALGLVAVLEGALYAAAPSAMKKAIRQVLDAPDTQIRTIGIGAMVLGLVIVWSVRG